MKERTVAVLLAFMSTLLPCGALRATAVPDVCSLPRQSAALLKRSRRPAVIEYLGGSLCERSTPPLLAERELAGLPLEVGLARLTAEDPRYGVAFVKGVAVVRPVKSARPGVDFLESRIAAFDVRDGSIWDAFKAVALEFTGFPFVGSGGRYTGPSEMTARTFSVSERNVTTVDAMVASVHAHGAVIWEISFCKAEPNYQNATMRWTTFDGHSESLRTAAANTDRHQELGLDGRTC